MYVCLRSVCDIFLYQISHTSPTGSLFITFKVKTKENVRKHTKLFVIFYSAVYYFNITCILIPVLVSSVSLGPESK